MPDLDWDIIRNIMLLVGTMFLMRGLEAMLRRLAGQPTVDALAPTRQPRQPTAATQAEPTSQNGASNFYCPCRCGTLPIAAGGIEVKATHDIGCAEGGSMHMIDASFLHFIESGAHLNPSKVDKVTGTLTQGQSVCGQLRELRVRAYQLEPDPNSRLEHSQLGMRRVAAVDVVLKDVLVVDSLPVPLHVSLSTLQKGSTRGSRLRGLGQPFDYSFGATLFPMRYRTHPYWAKQDSVEIAAKQDS